MTATASAAKNEVLNQSFPANLTCRRIRIAYLAPVMIERLLLKQGIPAAKIAGLIDIAAKPQGEQEKIVFGSN